MSEEMGNICSLLKIQFDKGHNVPLAARKIISAVGHDLVSYLNAQKQFKKFCSGSSRSKRKHGSRGQPTVNKRVLAHRLQRYSNVFLSELQPGLCSISTIWNWLKKPDIEPRRTKRVMRQPNERQKQQRLFFAFQTWISIERLILGT